MKIVDGTPFAQYVGKPLRESLGTKPGLCWIPIANLRIDPAYQREVLRNGARNIGKIARAFDWALAGVVVVANIGDGLFAIVDGQHRTIAASLRGIEEVPCLIIEADLAKQAEAFAAINGATTAMSPLSIFTAEVTAGKKEAVELVEDCALAGVTICRYPVPSDKMKPGETLAVKVLQQCRASYGRETFVLALKCITHGKDRVGLVKAAVIRAMCQVLDAEPSWRSPEYRLISVIEKCDLRGMLIAAENSGKRKTVYADLSMSLFDYLDSEIGA